MTGLWIRRLRLTGWGLIAAWNKTAVEIFGILSTDTIGKPCSEVICGVDEDGNICSGECIVRHSSFAGRQIHDFDLRIRTLAGQRWFNVALIVLQSATAMRPYIIHILRSVDIHKRLEVLLRDYLIRNTDISKNKAVALVSSTKSLTRETFLTKRETQILKLVSKGGTSLTIAEKLKISPTTVGNQVFGLRFLVFGL